VKKENLQKKLQKKKKTKKMTRTDPALGETFL
jgi:hypothetical protein